MTRALARVIVVAIAIFIVADGVGLAQTAQESSALTPTARPPNELRLTWDAERRSNGYEPGREVSMEISRNLGRRRWHGGIRSSTRFALNDESVVGGVAHAFSGRVTALVEVEASSSHRVVPRWGLAGRVDASMGKGWVVVGGVRHRAYDLVAATLMSAGVERYMGAYRMAYTLFGGRIPDGGVSASHLTRIDRLYGSDQINLVGLGVSAGTELEHLGPAGIQRTRVRALFLSGRHWVNPRWGVTYGASVTRRTALYSQTGVSAGLVARF
jgi:YaiO family outer membrane protein